ncbi:hypothetical protein BFW01_g974 [Lasiodiplodia theobromae]|uniref:Uncharacterized protein n=1 Tax=Lasiodiplodia theobromae TaxID=45133 RepID=A0A8H7MBN6_9PEZI|nr:hypothetical protein BFW01_g974 [Lasiodiplodia theobromae]
MSEEARRSNRVRRKPQTLYPNPPPPQLSPRKQKRKQPPASTNPPSRAKRYPANTRTNSTLQATLEILKPDRPVLSSASTSRITRASGTDPNFNAGYPNQWNQWVNKGHPARAAIKSFIQDVQASQLPQFHPFNRALAEAQSTADQRLPARPPPAASPSSSETNTTPPKTGTIGAEHTTKNTLVLPAHPFPKLGSSSSCLVVGDVGFWDAAIAPCNVKVGEDTREYVNVHFGLSAEDQAPFPGPASFYSKFKGLKVNNIFNDTTDEYCEMVANEYKALVSYKDSNEAEFQRSSYYLFKFEARNPGMAKDYIFRTEATPQESIRTDPENFPRFETPNFWNTPPSFTPNSAEHFDYDISPGLLYWLSLNGFSTIWGAEAKRYVHIRGQRKLCPYLAVEYKIRHDEDSSRISMNRVTAAMLLCLWNRFQLRKRALAAQGKDWKQEENSEIKVYGVRVLAAEFNVWVMTPVVNSEGEWQGTEMKRLTGQTLQAVMGVQRLCLWINEIHKWALTIHAQQVKEDLQACAPRGGAPPEQSVLLHGPS